MKKFLRSFTYAFSGLRQIVFVESNFTIHIVAAFIAVALCVLLQVSDVEFLIVIVCIAAVIAAEIFNSAIEKLCDFVQPQKHQQIKIIKDLCAAAVLTLALTSFIVGIIIFVPKLVNVF